MSIGALITTEALDAGLLLSRNGDRLHIESPLGRPLPEDLHRQLRDHKREVLAWIDFREAADELLKAAELYEGLGRHQEARILRVELAERWRPCIGELRRHGLLESRADAGMVEGEAAERPEQIEPSDPVVEGPGTSNATDDPWERIRTEYGLFTLSRE